MSSSITSPLDEAREKLADQMTLLGHLEELRDRLVVSAIAVGVCTVISAAFTPWILRFLNSFLPGEDGKLITLAPTEGIAVYFRVALTAGLVLAMPVLVYQLLMFILPGLEENEKRYVFWGVPAATLLFLIGVSFAVFILLPTAINFLWFFQQEFFAANWQSRLYIPFITSITFWIGVSFETPLIIFIMAKLDIVTPRFLLKQWRFAVVIIAIAAAMITPTVDPFNMALVMLPLFALYGLSILLSYLA